MFFKYTKLRLYNFFFRSTPSVIGATLVFSLFSLIQFCAAQIESTLQNYTFLNIFLNAAPSANLISIYSGISSIIFALILFIVEASLNRRQTEKGKIFLSHSYTSELVLYTVLGFLSFVFSENQPAHTLHTCTVALGSLISLGLLLKLTLDTKFFSEARKKKLSKEFKNLLELEFQDRIQSNSYYSEFDNNKENIRLKFSYSPLYKDKVYIVKASKTGEVERINTDVVKQISAHIEDLAKKQGFTFFEDEAPIIDEVKFDKVYGNDPKELQPPKFNNYRSCHLYHSKKVTPNMPIFSFDKLYYPSESDLETLTKLANRAFTVKTGPSIKDKFLDELNSKVEGISEFIRISIGNKNYYDFKQHIEIFDILIETFIQKINALEPDLSLSQAKRDFNSPLSNWHTFCWSQDIFLENLDQAFTLPKESKIYIDFSRIPIKFLTLGVRHNEYLSFFQGKLYWFESLRTNIKRRDFNKVKSSIQQLKYFIFSEVTPESTVSEDQLKVFQNELLLMITGIIRLLVENDLDLVQEIKSLVNSVVDDIETDVFKAPNISFDEIESRIQQFNFIMASWLIENKHSISKKYFDYFTSKLPNDPVILINWFLAFTNKKVEDYWGHERWNWLADGNARMVTPHELAHNLLSNKLVNTHYPSRVTDELMLKYDHQHLFREGSHLVNKIKTFKVETKPALDFINKISSEISLIREYKISEADISKAQLKKFKDQFFNFLKGKNKVRDLFEGSIEFSDEHPADENTFWVINQIDEKAAFLEMWDTHYTNWGEPYAQSSLRGEEFYILSQIQDNCAKKEMKSFSPAILNQEFTQDSIILSDNRFFSDFHSLKNFKLLSKVEKKHYGSNFNYKLTANVDVPVLFIPSLKNKIIIGNITALPNLKLYKQNNIFNEPYKIDIFDMSKTNSKLEEMLTSPSEWLKEYGDSNAQKKYLSTKVLIQIQCSMAVTNPKDQFGTSYEIKGPSETEQ